MTTQTPPTNRPRRSEDPSGATPRRAAGRAVVGSIAAGALAALALALVVFAGGSEGTITGALLLGFGFGWALMALLTVRRTRQPQRWAAVPAVAMGVTGAALVVATPSDRTMTALTWVWPPLVLALAVWMFVQMRRSVTGKARWVLTPVVGVLALGSLGAVYGNVVQTTDEVVTAAPGKLYDVGGHRLHLDCQGEGSPTVVLSNGLGGVSAAWARITTPVSPTTRVCAYDRAGQGWSDEASSPLDGVESAEELEALLAAAGEEGPFVLVGHSMGGPYAMTFAARYPEQVAGLVLLDSSSPEQFTRVPAYPGQYQMLRRMYSLMPTLSRLGLGHLVPGASHLPADEAAKVDAITSTPRFYRNQRDEVSVIPELLEQSQELTTVGDRPVAVLTASATLEGTAGWDGAQDALAALSSNSVHRTVHSSHAGMVDDPHPAGAAVRAITDVVSSVRSGQPLAAR
jgi:pimeloyl-ACP methyl ester carboxylesterase